MTVDNISTVQDDSTWGGRRNYLFMRHTFLVVTVKKWLKLMYIYGSYHKINTVITFFGPLWSVSRLLETSVPHHVMCCAAAKCMIESPTGGRKRFSLF